MDLSLGISARLGGENLSEASARTESSLNPCYWGRILTNAKGTKAQAIKTG